MNKNQLDSPQMRRNSERWSCPAALQQQGSRGHPEASRVMDTVTHAPRGTWASISQDKRQYQGDETFLAMTQHNTWNLMV